jgi:Conjugal transfer protein TraD
MRSWEVERRRRTRHLIELGGLVVKARIVELTDDDRTLIYGALIWMAQKLRSDQGEHAREIWTVKGKMAFVADRESEKNTVSQAQHDPK